MPEAKTGGKEQAQGKSKDNSLMQWARLMQSTRISLKKKMHHVSSDINPLMDAYFNAVNQGLQGEGTLDGLTAAAQDYRESNYSKVYDIIESMDSVFLELPYTTFDDPTGENHEAVFTDDIGLKELFVLYYFTTRPDIKPSGHDAAKIAEEADNIRATYRRFDTFLVERFKERAYQGGFISDAFDDEGLSDDAILEDIKAFIKAEHPADANEVIAKIASQPILEELIYPIDKVNRAVWNLFEKDAGGQIGIHLEKTGSKTEIMGVYSIDFSGIEDLITQAGGKITKALTRFDKRIYVVVDSLYQSGRQYMTIPEIYKHMGHKQNPPQREIDKIIASLKKMESAKIYLTNQAEIDAGYNYPLFKYYGSALPMELVTVEKDGATVNSALHPLKELPLAKFARDRKQCTKIPAALLLSPINKTDTSLAIEDYAIERISRYRNDYNKATAHLKRLQRKPVDKRTDDDTKEIAKLQRYLNKPLRMLYETIFTELHITGTKQRQRAKETLRRLLDWYKEQNYIVSFDSDGKGISVKV